MQTKSLKQFYLKLQADSPGYLTLNNFRIGLANYNYSLTINNDQFDSVSFIEATPDNEPPFVLSLLPKSIREPVVIEMYTGANKGILLFLCPNMTYLVTWIILCASVAINGFLFLEVVEHN